MGCAQTAANSIGTVVPIERLFEKRSFSTASSGMARPYRFAFAGNCAIILASLSEERVNYGHRNSQNSDRLYPIPKTAIAYIHSLGRFTGKPGLHRIRALCAALGDPQDRLQFVHIAGTNGKGSTACLTAAALRAAGLRVGLYTSPYLVQFYERIRVDGAMISDADLNRLPSRAKA